MRYILSAICICLIFSVFSQDRIYLRNGLLYDARVIETNDSTVIAEGVPGGSIPIEEMYFVKYHIGAVKAFRGHYARTHRCNAHVFYPTSSRNLLAIGWEPVFIPGITLSFERFVNPVKSQSLRLSLAIGTDRNNGSVSAKAYGYAPNYRFGLDYYRYTTLERRVRYFTGVGLRTGSLYVTNSPVHTENPHKTGEQRPFTGGLLTVGLLINITPHLSVSFAPGLGMVDISGRGLTQYPELYLGIKYGIPEF